MYGYVRNGAKAENANADELRPATGAALAQDERAQNALASPMSRPNWAWSQDRDHYDWMDWHTPPGFWD
jgi:hypothetical protein